MTIAHSSRLTISILCLRSYRLNKERLRNAYSYTFSGARHNLLRVRSVFYQWNKETRYFRWFLTKSMNYYPHGRGVTLNVCEWSMGVVGNTILRVCNCDSPTSSSIKMINARLSVYTSRMVKSTSGYISLLARSNHNAKKQMGSKVVRAFQTCLSYCCGVRAGREQLAMMRVLV